MKYPTRFIIILCLIFIILVSGCTSPYPTQTVTITGKYSELGWLGVYQYYIIDQDGDIIQIYISSSTVNKETWESLKIGTTYICDINSGGTNNLYKITRVVAEVKNENNTKAL